MDRTCNEQAVKNFMDLLTSPLFKMNFFDFYTKMQKEGIDAAKRFWSMTPSGANIGNMVYGPELFEKLIDFYIVLGFVPRYKYDEALRESQRLREENRILKDTINDFQANLFKEGGQAVQQVQQSWQSIIDRQLDMNRDVVKNFFDFYQYMVGARSPKSSQSKQSQAS